MLIWFQESVFNSVFNIFNVTSVKRFWTFRILALYKYFIIIIIIITFEKIAKMVVLDFQACQIGRQALW